MRTTLRRLASGTLLVAGAASFLAGTVLPAAAGTVDIGAGRDATPVGTLTWERTQATPTTDVVTLTVDTAPVAFDEVHVCWSYEAYASRTAPGQCPLGIDGPATGGTVEIVDVEDGRDVHVQVHVAIDGETAFAGNTTIGRGAFFGDVLIEDEPDGGGDLVTCGPGEVLSADGGSCVPVEPEDDGDEACELPAVLVEGECSVPGDGEEELDCEVTPEAEGCVTVEDDGDVELDCEVTPEAEGCVEGDGEEELDCEVTPEAEGCVTVEDDGDVELDCEVTPEAEGCVTVEDDGGEEPQSEPDVQSDPVVVTPAVVVPAPAPDVEPAEQTPAGDDPAGDDPADDDTVEVSDGEEIPAPVIEVLDDTVVVSSTPAPAPTAVPEAIATLPRTGADETLALTGLGVALLGAGAALELAGRRRRTVEA